MTGERTARVSHTRADSWIPLPVNDTSCSHIRGILPDCTPSEDLQCANNRSVLPPNNRFAPIFQAWFLIMMLMIDACSICIHLHSPDRHWSLIIIGLLAVFGWLPARWLPLLPRFLLMGAQWCSCHIHAQQNPGCIMELWNCAQWTGQRWDITALNCSYTDFTIPQFSKIFCRFHSIVLTLLHSFMQHE